MLSKTAVSFTAGKAIYYHLLIKVGPICGRSTFIMIVKT
ncbi:hypothetical protein SAMN05421827_12850 [Pedobacter terrae]|uniref:Uncharacterized protein n=1 Tax=Pedobacter terrae TaxID=405671 RepID=A0A1G8D9U1_9SPHI|nr:hypothetical protein SAMN05421827_12850 [Pedobacter terrae]